MNGVGLPGRPDKQGGGGKYGHKHTDEMGDSAAGILDFKFKFHMDVSFMDNYISTCSFKYYV